MMNRRERKLNIQFNKYFRTSFIAILCINFIFLYIQFIDADKVIVSPSSEFIWHKVPFIVLVIVLLALFASFISITNRFNAYSLENTKVSSVIYWASGIAISLIAAFIAYFPNSGNYHLDAYYSSIYNVTYGIPYSDIFGSIYGHYGILFVPFISLSRLLGATNMLKVVPLLLSAITFTTYILVTYSISVFVKNKSIRCLGICSMAFTFIAMRSDNYFQVHPHRIFIIAITMALIAFAVKHPKMRRLIIAFGFGLCALMIVWSTEMGIFATVVWIAFFLSIELQQYKLISIAFLKKTVLYLFFGALSLLVALGIVDFYNLLNGGELLSLKSFMHPFFAANDIVETLSFPLNNMTTSWIFVVFLFLYFLGKGIWSTHLCIKNAEARVDIAAQFAISILGLTSVTYFINRPAYFNLDIILTIAVLLLCIIANDALPFIKAVFNKNEPQNYTVRHGIAAAFGLTSSFVLFALSLGTFINMSSNLEKIDTYKQTVSLTETAKIIAENVPADTKAWGCFIPELYAIMNRNTQIHCADYPDMYFYPAADKYLEKMLFSMKDEAFLTTSIDYIKKLPEAYDAFIQTHYLGNIWNGGGLAFLYYLPIGQSELIDSFPNMTITGKQDISAFGHKLNVETGAKYVVTFKAYTNETPGLFYVDLYGDNFDSNDCQVNFTIDPQTKCYSGVLNTISELPRNVYIRIITQCNSDIRIEDFKIYKVTT